jgi:hypothetical protein
MITPHCCLLATTSPTKKELSHCQQDFPYSGVDVVLPTYRPSMQTHLLHYVWTRNYAWIHPLPQPGSTILQLLLHYQLVRLQPITSPVITDIFFTNFICQLTIMSHGYALTTEYPTYPDLTQELLYMRTDNLLRFHHLMYNNMTYLSADGYTYQRQHAGIPSGLFLTQYLDSFGNLFLIIDSMIEFGLTDEEILNLRLLVLGDDNCGFTHWPIEHLQNFN